MSSHIAVTGSYTYMVELHDIDTAGRIIVILDGDVTSLVKHLPQAVSDACTASIEGAA